MDDNLAQGDRDNWVLRRAAGGGSFKFSNSDPIHELSRLALAPIESLGGIRTMGLASR